MHIVAQVSDVAYGPLVYVQVSKWTFPYNTFGFYSNLLGKSLQNFNMEKSQNER